MVNDGTAYATFNEAYTELQTLYNEGGDNLQSFVRGALKLLRNARIPYYRKALASLARVAPEVDNEWIKRLEAEILAKSVLLDSKGMGSASNIDEVWQACQELKEIVDAVLAPKHDGSQPGVLTGYEASAFEAKENYDELLVVVKPEINSAEEVKTSIESLDSPNNLSSISGQSALAIESLSGAPRAPSAARLEIVRAAKEAGYHDEPGKPSAKLKDLFAKSVELGFGGDQPYKNPMLKRTKDSTAANP
nr:hypothetical protein B0A51_03337 [Rachicladosporium sp. CCFEE 5018]